MFKLLPKRRLKHAYAACRALLLSGVFLLSPSTAGFLLSALLQMAHFKTSASSTYQPISARQCKLTGLVRAKYTFLLFVAE